MENKRSGTFINGKEQAEEILRMLSPAERTRILSNINLRNPSLANELRQNSMSVKDMESYSPDDYTRIFPNVRPEVIGLALKKTNKDFQKNILRIAPRDYAEKAFKTLMLNLPASKEETIQRAKKVVITELAKS